MNTSRTVVFGLSGNPPTKNHALFIKHLLSLPRFDKVRVVLSNASPLKLAEDYLEPEARLELLKVMLEAEGLLSDKLVIERLELDRPPPSYMIDTLKALKARAPDERITLALGLDTLKTFTKWHEWSAFGGLCEIEFYPRADEVMSEEEIDEALEPLKQAHINAHAIDTTQEPVPMTKGSATDARAHYKFGYKGVPEGITKVVDEMIRERGYYS